MIGIPVTRELVKAGFNVTALVRNPEKAKQIFPNGVNFIKGDIEDKNSILNSLKDADSLYINISTKPTDKEHKFNPEMQGIDNILDSVKKSNIKQIVYLSSFLARNYVGNWWVMNAKKDGISKIKSCGIPYTIFYPSNFMENFASGMIRNGKITVPKASVNNKAWWIAGEDFGKIVSASFNTENAKNKEYPVQGLEGLTMEEAARKYATAYTKNKLSVGTMPFGFMKLLGVFIPQMNFISKLMGVMLNNLETFESQQTWNELVKPTVTLNDFAKKNVA
jgi:uncharacterized protein YbjT (DUF2867 family)